MTIQSNVHSIEDHAKRLRKSSGKAFSEFAADGYLSDTENFIHDARRAAYQFECRFLFEFPAALIDHSWDKAAAILCPDGKGYRINFLLFRDEDKEISIVEAPDVPTHLLNFACSFANILTVLPAGKSELVQ